MAPSAELRGRALDSLVSARNAVVARMELPVAVGLALAALAAAWSATTPVRVAGALGAVAIAVSVGIEKDRAVARSRIVAAAGLTVLTFADAGLAEAGLGDIVAADTAWRPLAAIIAYPVLGRALLNLAGRYRLVRSADIVVEAVLIGAAAAMSMQIIITHMAATSIGWDPAGAGLPSLLAGLDTALVVVLVRALTRDATRRIPVLVVAGSIGALLVGHLVAGAQLASGTTPNLLAMAPIAVSLVAFGAGCVYDAVIEREVAAPVEAALFSPVHAGVLVVAVVAPPIALAAQIVWGISISGSVAVGAGLIGTVLAIHVVSLLQERADNEHQATHDALTDLPNRLLFMDRLERALAHAARNDSPVGVLYVDLDRFKDVNDTFGHEAGDHLLRETAQRLAACARHEDTVARLAGDEFAILLPHLADADDVFLVANRVLVALREPFDVGGHAVHSVASVGAAVYPHDGRTPGDLVNAADAAMYRAKDRGGALVELYSAEMHDRASTRLELETALVHAIQHDELVLHYQPIVDATTGRTCGAESLVRWEHPEQGLIPPGDFIPVAEQSDLIIDLGNWVIRAACRQLADWTAAGAGDRFVTVNVSPRHFRTDLVSAIAGALRETGVDPSRLVVELTENAAVQDVDLVIERLRELRSLGVTAAIDDFGTGYCGLQYLGELPVSILKLDRSFIQAMTPSSTAIVTATIAMARSLGLTLVVEGVETDEQRRFLEARGCDRMQGFHLGRPMPAADFLARLREEDPLYADPRFDEALRGVIGEDADRQAREAADIGHTSVAEPAQR